MNRPSCDAIHLTEIDTSIECDTFIPEIDTRVYQPWCSSVPITENGLRFCFTSFVRVKSCADGDESNGSQSLLQFYNGKRFSFLPKMVFDQHEEFRYLNMVDDIISNGNVKNDRTGTGTLSRFGTQMKFNLRRSFPLLTTKVYAHCLLSYLEGTISYDSICLRLVFRECSGEVFLRSFYGL